MFKIKIYYNNDIREIIVLGKKSLLTELEERNVLVNYNCRQGHCGICIAILLAGDIITNDVLHPLNNNEILLCSTKAKSDLVIKI